MSLARPIGRLGLGAMLFLLASSVHASDVDVLFYATVDRDRVELRQSLTLTVTATVDDTEGVTAVQLPEPSGFDTISSRRSVQSSFRFGTGGRQAERSKIFTIVLRANTSGVQTIPPAVMEYRGRTYRTNPIPVEVVPIGQGRREEERRPDPQRRPGGLPSLFDRDFDPMDLLDELSRQMQGDPFGPLGQPGPGGISPPDVADGDVFVRVAVDKKEAWLGEQITADIVIYSRYDIGGFPTPPTMPQMDGFWQEDLERPRHIRPRMQQIRGRNYRAYLLRRLALFPTRAGEIEIDPVEVEIETSLGLFRGGRATKRRSSPVTINVRPLPPQGRPPGFAATNVGDWRMTASLDKPRTTTGEPVTLELSITGDGNVHVLEPPALTEIDGLRIYEPSQDQETRKQGGRFGGTKTLSYVIVPNRTGSFTIPAMDFHFFDPVAERYRTTSTRPLTMTVTAGRPTQPGAAMPSVAGSGINILDPDALRTIRYGVTPSLVGPPPYRSPVFLGMVGLSTALLIGLAVADALRRRIARAAVAGRGRRAPSVAKARLRSARRSLRKGERRGAAVDVLEALQDYVSVAADVRVRGLSREAVRYALAERGCPSELAEAFCEVLESCESVRYSPFEPEEREVSDLIERAAEALSKLFSISLKAGGKA